MDLEYFNQSNDNLYKYIVIIGLSLFLIPQFTNNSIIDNMVELIKLEHEINVKYEEVKLHVKMAEDIHNRIKEKEDAFYIYLNTHVSEMDLHLPNGTRVETFNDLKELWVHINKMNLEAGDIEIIEEFQIIFGIPENANNVTEIFDEIIIRLDPIKDFIDQNSNELILLNEEIQKAADENTRLSREINNNKGELRRIEIENEIYSREKMLNTIIKFTGILMIVIGTILWYIKIQRYLDGSYKNYKKGFHKKTRY